VNISLEKNNKMLRRFLKKIPRTSYKKGFRMHNHHSQEQKKIFIVSKRPLWIATPNRKLMASNDDFYESL